MALRVWWRLGYGHESKLGEDVFLKMPKDRQTDGQCEMACRDIVQSPPVEAQVLGEGVLPSSPAQRGLSLGLLDGEGEVRCLIACAWLRCSLTYMFAG